MKKGILFSFLIMLGIVIQYSFPVQTTYADTGSTQDTTKVTEGTKTTTDTTQATNDATKDTQSADEATNDATKDTQSTDEATNDATKDTQSTDKATNDATKDTQSADEATNDATKDTQSTDEATSDATKDTQSTDKATNDATNDAGTSTASTQQTADVVHFKDANLAQAIRDQLNITGDITKSELLKLTSLYVFQDKNISDLSGMEYATNLQTFYLRDNHVTDISPLLKLDHLESIDLSGNGISDISGLAQLPQLTRVSLNSDKITNVEALTKLSHLQYVDLQHNPLNLNPGSAASKVMQTLVAKDMIVLYDGVAHFRIKKVTKNSITVDWDISKKYLSYGSGAFQLLLSLNDGPPVKTFQNFDVTEYTFTGLQEGKTYTIGFELHSNLRERGNMITKKFTVKTEDVKQEKKVSVQPTIAGDTATISYKNINSVSTNGVLELNATKYTGGQLNLQMTAEQIKMLQDAKASVEVKKGDATVKIPAANLGNGKDVNIAIERQKPVDGALSSVYDFTIETDSGDISQFSEPVTLSFPVDAAKVKNPDNVKVWYYNPQTKKWELIGGTYANGMVTAQTSHFSTYAVFEKKDEAQSSSDTTANGSTGGETGNELPVTATNTMNFIVLGILFILSAMALMFIQKRRERQ